MGSTCPLARRCRVDTNVSQARQLSTKCPQESEQATCAGLRQVVLGEWSPAKVDKSFLKDFRELPMPRWRLPVSDPFDVLGL
jgi:hypothetical protein